MGRCRYGGHDPAGPMTERGARRRQAHLRAARATWRRFFALIMVGLAGVGGRPGRRRAGGETRTVYAAGRIVPIPASIPHEDGDMIDRRILPDLRWIAARFRIYVTDGYSGPLPGGGGRAGCNRCHTRHSDHYNGLAVDIVPEGGGTEMRPELAADHAARALGRAPPEPSAGAVPLGRLQRRRRPRLRQPSPPLLEPRPGPRVQARRVGRSLPRRPKSTTQPPPPPPPTSPPEPTEPIEPPRKSPTGGVSQIQTGGVSPRRD